MNCPQCGSAIEESAKFCANCGAKVETATEAAAAAASELPISSAAQSAQSAQPVQQETPNQAQSSAGSTANAKNMANDYFSFLWNSLKNPGATAESVNASQKVHGLVTMGILALLVPLLELFTGLIYRDSGRSSSFSFDDIFGLIADPGKITSNPYMFIDTQTLMQNFLFSIITFALSMTLIIVVLFLTANLLKVNISFMDVTARFGAFMVIPAAIFILKSLIGLVSLFSLANYVNSFAMLGVAVAILYTFQTFKAKASKLDTFYIYTILLVLSYLLHRIITMILY